MIHDKLLNKIFLEKLTIALKSVCDKPFIYRPPSLPAFDAQIQNICFKTDI